MSIEKQLTDVSALMVELLAHLKAGTQQNVEANASPTVVEQLAAKAAEAATVVVGAVEIIPAGGTVVPSVPVVEAAPLVLQFTALGLEQGCTLDAFYDVGWKDEGLVDQGYAEWVTPAPVAVTEEELNKQLGLKAAAMNDQGAAIYKLLKDKYKVNGVKELDAKFHAALSADVEAL